MRNQMLMSLSLSMLFVLGACSSKRKVKDVDNSKTIKKDYLVRDASSTIRPGWVEDSETWVNQEKMDTKKYRYFSFETEPKVNREISCNLAKANVRADIAAEITTFIQQSLAASEQGQAAIDPNNPKTEALRNFVENTLAQRVQALIHGTSIVNTYWEKRAFEKKLGAKKDYQGFTCAVLVRMEAQRLSTAIDKASEEVVKKADDPEVKDNVKKALENLDESFIKARRGEV